ncbi:hypothetical protein AAMO2058_000195400 [Amorphochlora amoebiformis]
MRIELIVPASKAGEQGKLHQRRQEYSKHRPTRLQRVALPLSYGTKEGRNSNGWIRTTVLRDMSPTR